MSESSNPSLRWLHISDPHLRDPRGPGQQGDQGEVLTAFLKFCHKPLRQRLGFRPDFVFITGDLAFSGTRDDYQGTGERTVRNFLDVLRRATGLDARRIYAVSGNHDVNRANVSRDTARGDLQIVALSQARESGDRIRNEVAERIYPPNPEDLDDRDRSLRRHEDYAEFCRSYWPERFAEPPAGSPISPGDRVLPVMAYAERVVVPGTSCHFGLAGLCSSWASQSAHRAQGQEDEPQTQFLCTRAVQDCLGALKDETFRIALLHHPPDWLLADEAEWLQSEGGLLDQVDLLLTGHTHGTDELWSAPPAGLRAIQCSAGSLFDGAGRNHAFHLVEVWPDQRRGRRLVVRWRGDSGTWEPDTGLGPEPDWAGFEWPGPNDATGSARRAARVERGLAELPAYCSDLLEGLTVTGVADARHRCGIDRLYVEPQVMGSHGSGLPAHAPEAEEDEPPERPAPPPSPSGLGDALRDRPWSVLIAASGAGKTTSLHWLAFHAARQHVHPDGAPPPPELGWLAELVPILVSARGLAEERERMGEEASGRGECLFRHLRTTAKDMRAGVRAEASARRAAQHGKALLLIDGLDELPPESRRWVIELGQQLTGNRGVLVTRPGGFEPAEHASGTHALVLLPWDASRMEAYLGRWFAFRSEWSDKHLSELELRERHEELLGATSSSEAIRSLAQTPLLLATLISLQELDGRLPEHRAELYDRCISVLLKHSTGGASDLVERQQAFDAVAYRLFVDREELNPPVERSAMAALLGRALGALRPAAGQAPGDSVAEAEALLEAFVHHASLLVEPSPGYFCFLHPAFQEYLTARYLRDAPPDARAPWETLLVYHAHEPRWREVIRLTAWELARKPGVLNPERLNRLMEGLTLRLTGPEGWQAKWADIADTVVGCLEDLGNREFPSILAVTNELIARAMARKHTLRSWEPPPRELRLALRLPICLARRGLLLSVASADLASACFAATLSANFTGEEVWPAVRAFSQVRASAARQSLEHVFDYFAAFGSRQQRFMALAVLGKWRKDTTLATLYSLAADLLLEQPEDRPQPWEIPASEFTDWQAVIREVEEEPILFAAVATVTNPLSVWSAGDYARAAVRAFSTESSRRAGLRVMRELVAQDATRSTALLVLEEGLHDDNRTIAIASAFLLAEKNALPAEAGARAAVGAFSEDSSREAGVRVLRGLLASEDDATRRAALGALKDGLLGGDFNTAVTSASLLAEEASLPAEQRAQAAARAFSATTTRETGERAMRELLAAEGTRTVALAVLEEGLGDADWDIAGTCASLLAHARALPAEPGARAAVRALQGESSRAAGVRVIRELLGVEATRPAALSALQEGLADDSPDTAVTSVGLLVEQKALPAELGARAAVRALRGESSRGAGVRAIRELLGQQETRAAALAELEAGLGDADPEIAGTSVSLLSEISALPAKPGAWAAVRAFRAERSRAAALRVMGDLLREDATRADALAALEEGLDDSDAEIAGMSATLLAEETDLLPEQRARAAARILSAASNRDAGARVMRELVADDATRPAALAALQEGLGDGDWDIAGASASLLAETRTLEPEQRARAAVRAFSAESSREAGVRVMRELLADGATRPAALAALTEGADDGDSDTAITSASLLAEEDMLAAEQGARAAVQAFHLGSSREAGVRVMRRLLRDNDSRQAALAALEDGLRERDRITAVTSARLLAEERALLAEQGARAALRALSAESSREAGVRVMLGLLADTASRRAALMALYLGERDNDPETARISALLVAGHREPDG